MIGAAKRVLYLVLAIGAGVVAVLVLMGQQQQQGYEYQRPPPGRTLLEPPPKDRDSTTPEQVHISMVGKDGMRISWITEDDKVPVTVNYGTSEHSLNQFSSSNGTTTSYSYTFMYRSGFIHNLLLNNLTPNTLYHYRLGSSSRQFTFKTPPSNFPIKFAIVGDLGQTEHTRSTLSQIANSNYDMLLLPGDLSYADYIQTLWDSFGRLVEPLASSRPWMVTQGNHEIEWFPFMMIKPFTAYNHRWRMPYEQSGSTSNLYYSFDVAGVHVIMLGSYTDFNNGSAQYAWLHRDLNIIDRDITPWVIVLVHAPWYNTNKAHQGEKESVQMKKVMEELLYKAKVDVVFAGHVHAYERFTRVYKEKADKCGPVYITIGDGGNREGLAKDYIDPKPEISEYREASFGHGQLEVLNATQAKWTWHRNDGTIGDSIILTSHSSNPDCIS